MAESTTFRILRVKCRDEMGGKYREKFGNDEIAGDVPPNGTGVVEFRGHDGIYEMEWDILIR